MEKNLQKICIMAEYCQRGCSGDAGIKEASF